MMMPATVKPDGDVERPSRATQCSCKTCPSPLDRGTAQRPVKRPRKEIMSRGPYERVEHGLPIEPAGFHAERFEPEPIRAPDLTT